ncbi:MAG: HU family DNA-binding protein [Alloprevotella sp.]|nr:HU family DNA-binding protein [Alloprevotella sp.]
MSYPYVTRAIKSPKDKSMAFYVQSARQAVVDMDELADRIANGSTVGRPDIKAVLDALQFEIIQALKNGRSVRLDEIGTIYSRLKSEGFPTQEACWKAGAKAVRKVTVCFRRSQEIAREVNEKTLSFEPSELELSRKKAAGAAEEGE